MNPLWTTGQKVTSSTSFIGNFFLFKSALIKENAKLKDELISLRLNKVDYDLVLEENQRLKEQMGRVTDTKRIMSNVLSKPPQSPFDTFIIEAGSGLGLNIGDKVYISDNIIIGKVASVTDKTSIVKLFSSGDEKNEVFLQRTGASFILSGSGSANFKLEVPREADIVWGDSVVYPGSLDSVVATVYFVDSNSQSSFKTVYFKIPGNIFQINRVFVEI